MFIIVDLVNIVNLVDTKHYRVKCQNLQNSVHAFDGFIDSNINCNKKKTLYGLFQIFLFKLVQWFAELDPN